MAVPRRCYRARDRDCPGKTWNHVISWRHHSRPGVPVNEEQDEPIETKLPFRSIDCSDWYRIKLVTILTTTKASLSELAFLNRHWQLAGHQSRVRWSWFLARCCPSNRQLETTVRCLTLISIPMVTLDLCQIYGSISRYVQLFASCLPVCRIWRFRFSVPMGSSQRCPRLLLIHAVNVRICKGPG